MWLVSSQLVGHLMVKSPQRPANARGLDPSLRSEQEHYLNHRLVEAPCSLIPTAPKYGRVGPIYSGNYSDHTPTLASIHPSLRSPSLGI